MGSNTSLGVVSQNLDNAATVFSSVLTNIFYAIGLMLVMASILRYRDHRQNSSQASLSSVLVRLIAGVLLVFLPWMINAFRSHIAQYSV